MKEDKVLISLCFGKSMTKEEVDLVNEYSFIRYVYIEAMKYMRCGDAIQIAPYLYELRDKAIRMGLIK